MDAKLELVKNWLAKASRDLASARRLAAGPDYFEAAQRLTIYATVFRYPGEQPEPEPEEFRAALKAAEEILLFVCDHLPSEVRPQPGNG